MKTITNDILKAAKFASTDETRPALETVRIDNDFIVATNGYKIIRIKHNGQDLADFPAIDKATKVETLVEPILINAKQLLKKLKFEKSKTLPILETVVLCNETPDFVSLASTDLDTSTVLQFKKCHERYPEYEAIFPKGEPLATTKLDVDKLIDTLQAFKTEGVSYIDVSVFDPRSAVKFTGAVKGNDHIEALLMPIRS